MRQARLMLRRLSPSRHRERADGAEVAVHTYCGRLSTAGPSPKRRHPCRRSFE